MSAISEFLLGFSLSYKVGLFGILCGKILYDYINILNSMGCVAVVSYMAILSFLGIIFLLNKVIGLLSFMFCMSIIIGYAATNLNISILIYTLVSLYIAVFVDIFLYFSICCNEPYNNSLIVKKVKIN